MHVFYQEVNRSFMHVFVIPSNRISFRWSVGAIMYEMLEGYPPFYSDGPISTCRKVKWALPLHYEALIPIVQI